MGPSPSSARGFSLPEVLVVVAVIALLGMLVVPFAATRIRAARTRASVAELALSLQATRVVAVTSGRAAELTVCPQDGDARPACHAGRGFTYTDMNGASRRIELAEGVEIVRAPEAIRFGPNGGVEALEPPVVELALDAEHGTSERWIVATSLGGVPQVSHVPSGAGEPPLEP